jgi:cyclopropane fatty-acyl-phospholipid synthase-like methyltransferase
MKVTYRDFLEAPFFGSCDEVIENALELAELKENDVFCDLGCGNGRALEIAAREFNAYAVGVELRLDLILGGKAAIFSRPQNRRIKDRIEFIHGNYHDVNLRNIDVVYAYLGPRANAKLAPKLARELKDKARIVTYEFAMPWSYDKRIYVNKAPVHLYVMSHEERKPVGQAL